MFRKQSFSTEGLFPEHWLFLCAANTYLLMWDLHQKYSIKFLTHLCQSLMSPSTTPAMMSDGDACMQSCIIWCDYVVITSCIVLFSKEPRINIRTLKELIIDWLIDWLTSIIKRKIVSSYFGVWPQKIIKLQCKLNDSNLIFQLQDQH